MKKTICAMVLMALFLVCGSGIISTLFTTVLGGGIEQSYLYPLYGAVIVLTGIVVGSAQMIINEINDVKKLLRDRYENHSVSNTDVCPTSSENKTEYSI